MTDASQAGNIVLFDGVCNFCNASVHFIIDRDPGNRYRFAALQSEIGRRLLVQHGLPPDACDSIVLLEGDRCYVRSTAALRIVRRLRWPWPFLYVFIVVPRFLRDVAYSFIARNRYRWFGRSEQCRLPTPQLRQRFLE